MKFVGIFSCGHCGCEEYHYIEAETLEKAEEYMEDWLPEYVGFWECEALNGFDVDEFDEDSEEVNAAFDWYYDNCSFIVREATEDEIKDEVFIKI